MGQFKGAVTLALLGFVPALILGYVLRLFGLLRVRNEVETLGLDVAEIPSIGYPEFAVWEEGPEPAHRDPPVRREPPPRRDPSRDDFVPPPRRDATGDGPPPPRREPYRDDNVPPPPRRGEPPMREPPMRERPGAAPGRPVPPTRRP